MIGKRWGRAGIAFVLAFAAAGIVWQNGRHEGIQETVKVTVAPTPTPKPVGALIPLSGRTLKEDEQRLAELITQSRKATTPDEKRAVSNALCELAKTAHDENRGGGLLSLAGYEEARRAFHEIGDAKGEVRVLTDLYETQVLLGNRTEAEKALQEALTLHRDSHGEPLKEADILYRFGDYLRIQGRYKEAKSCLNDSLSLRQKENEETGIADCLKVSGQVAFEEGLSALARQLTQDAIRLYEKNGKLESRAAALGILGDIALEQGETAEADRLYREGLAVWQAKAEGFWIGRFNNRLAKIALKRDDLAEAKRLAEESHSSLSTSNGPITRAAPLLSLAEVARREGDVAQAHRLLNEAHALYTQVGSSYGLAQCESMRIAWSNDKK